jgi:hypothetical protein
MRTGIFLQRGLDWANQLDPSQEFKFFAQRSRGFPHALSAAATSLGEERRFASFSLCVLSLGYKPNRFFRN